jgi:hypothetical protein
MLRGPGSVAPIARAKRSRSNRSRAFCPSPRRIAPNSSACAYTQLSCTPRRCATSAASTSPSHRRGRISSLIRSTTLSAIASTSARVRPTRSRGLSALMSSSAQPAPRPRHHPGGLYRTTVCGPQPAHHLWTCITRGFSTPPASRLTATAARAHAQAERAELSGRFSGNLDEQLVGDGLEDLVHELVAPGIAISEGERFGQPGSADGQDSLAQRFPRQSLLVDVANGVPAGVALAEAHRFATAIDARGAARLLHQPLLDPPPPVCVVTRTGGAPVFLMWGCWPGVEWRCGHACAGLGVLVDRGRRTRAACATRWCPADPRSRGARPWTTGGARPGRPFHGRPRARR